MIIRAKGLTLENIESAVRLVNIDNELKFGAVLLGRNTVHGGATVQAKHIRTNRNGSTWNVKVGAVTGSPAARLAPSGRRGPWACWFTFRDVLGALYGVHDDAVVRTAFITYRSADDFFERFPDTYRQNAGSEWNRRQFGELCYDLGYHDQHDRSN